MIGAARFPSGVELRASTELRAAGRKLAGYAAVFGAVAQMDGYVESITPGAFRASLAAKGDILALVDHDPGRLLARTSSGTLRLREDDKGLAFELDVPDTTLGRDILAMSERGDLGGMSFAFRMKDEAWPANGRRELRAVELLEVSVVQAFPAYTATTVEARRKAIPVADILARRRYLETL